MKTLSVERRCRYIIPTTNCIFLTRKNTIYKIEINDIESISDTDIHGSVYYSGTNGYIRGNCIVDEKYLYFSTMNTFNKLSIHDSELYSINLILRRSKKFLSKDYVIIFDSNSGVIFIKKDDFSKFACKNYYIDLTSVAVHNNTIAYICRNDVYLFDIEDKNDQVVVLPVPVENSVENTIEKIDESTDFHSEKGFKKIDIKNPMDIDEIYNKYTVKAPYRSVGMNAFYPKCRIFEKLKKFSVNKSILKKIHEYENKRYGKNAGDDLDQMIFEFADNPIEILTNKSDNELNDNVLNYEPNSISNNISIASLIPSPQISQNDDCFTQKDNKDQLILPINHRFNSSNNFDLSDEMKLKIKTQHLKMKMKIEKVRKICARNGISLEKWDDIDEESSNLVEDRLFFDQPENTILNKNDHFMLKSIFEVTQSKLNHKFTKDKIKMKKIFKKVTRKVEIQHPVTYAQPLEPVRLPFHRKIEFSISRSVYTVSTFFIKNHFDFFKKRFQPRDINEPERPIENGIYPFIEDEFKKIVGYTQEAKPKPVIENTIKKKRGGF